MSLWLLRGVFGVDLTAWQTYAFGSSTNLHFGVESGEQKDNVNW